MKLGFPIAIPLREIARNCSRVGRNRTELRAILGVYRALNCAQLKSTCVGTLIKINVPVQINGQTFCFSFVEKSNIQLKVYRPDVQGYLHRMRL